MDMTTDKAWLMYGNCLDRMDELIAMGIKVDAIICDPPYGTTANKWDSVIPTDLLWPKLHSLIKDNGAIVLFGNEPFSSVLRMSNHKNYKYDWKWVKNATAGFVQCKNRPMTKYEDIMVFSEGVTVHKGQSNRRMPYHPQGLQEINKTVSRKTQIDSDSVLQKRPSHKPEFTQTHTGYPSNVLEFNVQRDGIHPTQKPVKLMEYLVKTYTNEGETVLDFTMGSGSTGVACMNTKRAFIGMEMDATYYGIACGRVIEAGAIC